MNRKWMPFAMLAASLTAAAADIKAPPWETPRLDMGRDLFRENCVVCHDIDKDQKHTRKLGPSLNHLLKNEKLPLSHGKPSRQYVAIRIKFGGTIMPAFAKRLTNSEIDMLMDYIASK
jgi:mono/diheme cytochrome c family protein